MAIVSKADRDALVMLKWGPMLRSMVRPCVQGTVKTPLSLPALQNTHEQHVKVPTQLNCEMAQ